MPCLVHCPYHESSGQKSGARIRSRCVAYTPLVKIPIPCAISRGKHHSPRNAWHGATTTNDNDNNNNNNHNRKRAV
jgi:hypothetical protein